MKTPSPQHAHISASAVWSHPCVCQSVPCGCIPAYASQCHVVASLRISASAMWLHPAYASQCCVVASLRMPASAVWSHPRCRPARPLRLSATYFTSSVSQPLPTAAACTSTAGMQPRRPVGLHRPSLSLSGIETQPVQVRSPSIFLSKYPYVHGEGNSHDLSIRC